MEGASSSSTSSLAARADERSVASQKFPVRSGGRHSLERVTNVSSIAGSTDRFAPEFAMPNIHFPC